MTILITSSAVILIAIIIFINRKWEAIKFFLFMRFNIAVNDDEPENLAERAFDAFVIYSHKDRKFMKNHILVYLEEELGFKLCIHERDFVVGETICAGIEAAINHSRRIIMIISR